MKRLLTLLIFFIFFQCQNKDEPEVITEKVFITDTVYLTPNGNTYEEPPWMISCDYTTWTQTEMNICSGKRYVVADSVMEASYYLLDSLCSKRINSNLSMKEREDWAIEELEFLRKTKESLLELQIVFYKYRSLAVEFERSAYYNATMQPLMVNTTGKSVTANHFRLLESLTASIR